MACTAYFVTLLCIRGPLAKTVSLHIFTFYMFILSIYN